MFLRNHVNAKSGFVTSWMLLALAALAVLAGCVASPAGTAADENTPQTAGDEAAAEAQLTWQGDVVVGDEAPRCHRLIILANDQVEYGPCDERTKAATLEAAQWDEIVSQFAPFSYQEGEVELTFNGQGETQGEAWQLAIANWAETKYAELYTGRACAACQTILHWSFGEVIGQPGECASLTVTNHGYATKSVASCDGGESQVLAQGWLTTEELARLQEWSQSRETIYFGEDNSSYLNGEGSLAMTQAEIAELTEWAAHVNDRLDD